MTFRYPVNDVVLNALGEFPKIKDNLRRGPNKKRWDKLEIVRLLNNPHRHRMLLEFIERQLDSSGQIGMAILNEADPVRLSQRLAELFLFVSLRSREQVNAKPSQSRKGKQPDIVLETGQIKAKIEIYSPIDNYGFQFVKRYYSPIFLYSDCQRGYSVDVELIVRDQTGYHAYAVPNHDKQLRKWLTDLECNVKNWLAIAEAGEIQEFDGVKDTFKLRVSLREVYDNPDVRWIRFHEPGRSTDVRLYFEGSPESNANNQMGKKILGKLEKRQCGLLPNPDELRVLILNFELTDHSGPDWFSLARTPQSIDQTIRVLIDKVGDPLPYDLVIPAMLDFNCYFGEAVILDAERETQIKQFIVQTGLDQKCQMRPEKPPPELVEALRRCVIDERI